MKKQIQNGCRIAVSILAFLVLSMSVPGYAETVAVKPDQAPKQTVAAMKEEVKKAEAPDQFVTAATSLKETPEISEVTGETDDLPEMAEDDAYNKDPLERINRAIFFFNDKLDFYLIKPIAELYNAILPKPLNKGIHNFFNNLGEIPTIINDLLQFNLYQMAKDVTRFSVNSTFGIGGLFDIATRMYYPYPYFQNDFGLTLARWGYKDSSYFVLPVLGSNTIRDGIFGIPVDYFEFSVYPYITPQSTRYQVLALFMIDHRANLLQFEPVLEEAAIDRYVFMRNAYMQHRAFQIEQVMHLGYKERANSKTEVASSVE